MPTKLKVLKQGKCLHSQTKHNFLGSLSKGKKALLRKNSAESHVLFPLSMFLSFSLVSVLTETKLKDTILSYRPHSSAGRGQYFQKELTVAMQEGNEQRTYKSHEIVALTQQRFLTPG